LSRLVTIAATPGTSPARTARPSNASIDCFIAPFPPPMRLTRKAPAYV
jgi:hypothetical protein